MIKLFENSNVERESAEPTAEGVADACENILSPETCKEIAGLELDDALGYAFTALLEAGIEDPEAFLVKKGVLE